MLPQPVPFGRYLLVELLAEGPAAEVFRAVRRDEGHERTVALKRLRAQAEQQLRRRVRQDLWVGRRLTHVNLAQLVDHGEVGGTLFQAFELVDGIDLERLAELGRRASTPLRPAMTAFIVAEAARGLAYLHEHEGAGQPLGLLHRHLAPSHVLVTAAGHVKLISLGRGHEAGAAAARYRSPEQVAAEPLDGRSDVFSLGVILHEALTGQPLVDADPARAARQLAAAAFALPSATNRAVPVELDRITRKALQRDRDARYVSAAEMARDLRLYLGERAPGLGRDDLGECVAQLAPPRREDPRLDDGRADEGEDDALGGSPGPHRSLTPRFSPTVAPRPSAVKPAATTKAPPPRSSRSLGLSLALLFLASLAALAWWAICGRGTVAPNPPVAPTVEKLIAPPPLPRLEALCAGTSDDGCREALAALDGLVCSPAADPPFPAPAEARLRALGVTDEARLAARQLLSDDHLPPALRPALDRLAARDATASSLATLAALEHPDDAALAVRLIRQQSARGRWREAPSPHPELCQRRAAVDHLARLAPADPLGATLARYVAAAPSGTPVVLDGLRFVVHTVDDHPQSRACDVTLRVTNASSETLPLAALGGARLAGSDEVPVGAPERAALAPNRWRDVRLHFSAVPAELRDGAVLRLAPGAELALFSEVLR